MVNRQQMQLGAGSGVSVGLRGGVRAILPAPEAGLNAGLDVGLDGPAEKMARAHAPRSRAGAIGVVIVSCDEPGALRPRRECATLPAGGREVAPALCECARCCAVSLTRRGVAP